MCRHDPSCPTAAASDREAAAVIVRGDVQGWVQLCNGLLLFEDTGGLLPDGSILAPHRPVPSAGTAAA
ncbi:DUF5999 family protein [Streptomyces sp. NPDC000880]